MAGDIYLADTTVYVLQGRYPQVRRRFAALLTEGRLAACQMTTLEYLNNAASPSSYESVWGALHEQRWVDVTTEAMDRALAIHRELASHTGCPGPGDADTAVLSLTARPARVVHPLPARAR